MVTEIICDCEKNFLLFQKYYFRKNYTWYADRLFTKFGYPIKYKPQRYITNVYRYPILLEIYHDTKEINHSYYHHFYKHCLHITKVKKIFINEERKNKLNTILND